MKENSHFVFNEDGTPCDEQGHPYYMEMKRSDALALIFSMMTPIESTGEIIPE